MNTDIDGVGVNCRIQGEGPWLLLLHGWGADLRCFDRIFKDLSSSFKVAALDFPGFGLSDDPPTEWGVGDYADFVAKFMDKSGIDRATVLGHSFGGRVAIKLASAPATAGRIEKLVLTGSAGLLRKSTFRGRIRSMVRAFLRGVFRFSGLGRLFPALKERLGRRFASRDYLAATPLMRKCLIKVVREDLAGLLPLIKAPTLLVWGADDTETPVADGFRMRSLIPGARLEVLENAGHFAFLNHPERFSELLREFLI